MKTPIIILVTVLVVVLVVVLFVGSIIGIKQRMRDIQKLRDKYGETYDKKLHD